MIWSSTGGGSAGEIFMRWYHGLLHGIPFLTTVADLWMTDMALEKSHWWIMFIAMFPFYMLCNWFGAYHGASPNRGTIYGPEMWETNVPLTMFIFACLALFQAAIFWCTSAIIDRIWPKREDEIFEVGADKLIPEI